MFFLKEGKSLRLGKFCILVIDNKKQWLNKPKQKSWRDMDYWQMHAKFLELMSTCVKVSPIVPSSSVRKLSLSPKLLPLEGKR